MHRYVCVYCIGNEAIEIDTFDERHCTMFSLPSRFSQCQKRGRRRQCGNSEKRFSHIMDIFPLINFIRFECFHYRFWMFFVFVWLIPIFFLPSLHWNFEKPRGFPWRIFISNLISFGPWWRHYFGIQFVKYWHAVTIALCSRNDLQFWH